MSTSYIARAGRDDGWPDRFSAAILSARMSLRRSEFMSEQIQSIVEAVRSLTPEQRRELMQVLATAEESGTSVSSSRRELVRAIQGKYRHVCTSSESFMARKRADLALESSSPNNRGIESGSFARPPVRQNLNLEEDAPLVEGFQHEPEDRQPRGA
jgi:hypothetical protein